MFNKTVLGDVLDFYNGKAIKPGGEGRYPAYGSNGVIGGCDDYRYENGIIIGRVGAYCGSVTYCPDRFWASDNTIVAKPKQPGSSTRFFAYMLLAMNLNRHAGGAAQPLVTQSTLKAVPANVPDLATQERIASILSAYDDLIENNTRRIAILEEMTRRIYEEWFVRFRYPGHEGVRMVESGLGPVPEGWVIRAFDELATFTNGYAFKPNDWNDEGLPIIKIKELKAGVQSDTPRHAGLLPEKYRIKHGDLLFSWSADLDVYVWGGDEGWLNQHLFLVHSKDSSIPKSYLYHALKEAMPSFRTRSNGATMKHIKRSALSEVTVATPRSDQAAAFDQVVRLVHELVMLLSRKNANLRATRDLLLPKLISGELDLSELAMPEVIAA